MAADAPARFVAGESTALILIMQYERIRCSHEDLFQLAMPPQCRQMLEHANISPCFLNKI